MQEAVNMIILCLTLLILTSLTVLAILCNFGWFKRFGYYQNRLHSYSAGAIALSVGLMYLILQ
ncbi:hypothetical protein [Lysinibacillus capsici]|uniref:hypothetical protein n=1 Tax=Lysinibacillus capsici TaxID=2115968 RepID=UPI000E209C5A|nr:hypothetical protein [Lysinibacillus capsici]RDV27734.1 hypothetical protein C7B89_19320 [Lysinibacillus capsici]